MTTAARSQATWKRVRRSVGTGVWVGAILCGVAIVGMVAMGQFRESDSLSALGIVAILYLGGGALAGATIGILMPIAKRPLGRLIVNTAAAVPVFAALFYMVYGFSWTWQATLALVISAPAFAIATTVVWHALGGGRGRSRDGR